MRRANADSRPANNRHWGRGSRDCGHSIAQSEHESTWRSLRSHPNMCKIGSMKMVQEAKTLEVLKTNEEPRAAEEETAGNALAPEDPKAKEKPKTDEELRRAPRLQCSGLAGVQTLPACDKPVPAKILDLSVGGCLMETDRPMTLALDEIVELIFCVNHMPFRVRGKVRAIRSEKLVGFQFPQLSDRTRMQIEDLVGELIDHLKKLHQESIANRPAEEERKHPLLPPVPSAAGALNRQPARPIPIMRGSALHPAETHRPPEPHRRWF